MATVEVFANSRKLAEFINTKKLSKDDIIAIIDREEQLFLIYYSK